MSRSSPSSRRTRRPTSLAKNSLAQTAPVFAGYIASFLSAPVVLAGLGLRNFGIWALTGALAQYGATLNLGLGRAISRYVAAYDAGGEPERIGELVGLGVLGAGAFFVPLAVIVWAAAGPIASAVGGVGVEEMRELLICAVGMAALAMLGQCIAAWPIGLRRMVAPNIALAAGAVVNLAFSVGVIVLGGGLVAYALANFAASLLSLVVLYVAVVAVEGMPPFAWPRRAHVREVIVFAAKGQVVFIGELVNYQTDKIVIAFAVGPAAAGAYDIANRVCVAARAVGVFTQGALPSVFTAQAAAEGIDAIRGAYVALTQRASAVSFPFLFFCAASAPLLLSGWLGRIPEHGTVILVVLCTAYVANVSSGVSYALAAAGDALALTARSATVTALANIALTVILSPLFGVWGVLAGTFVALSAGAIYQIVLVQRRFGIPLPHYWQAIRRSLQFAALAAIPVVAVSFLAAQRIPRVAEICLLLVLTGAYFAGYGVLAMRRDLLPGALSRPLARLPVLSVLAARD